MQNTYIMTIHFGGGKFEQESSYSLSRATLAADRKNEGRAPLPVETAMEHALFVCNSPAGKEARR